jgi:hypothetical protein
MAKVTRSRRRSKPRTSRLTLDEALLALFIGAMNANDHVAAAEAARAHHLIWSTRRFRRRSGDSVGKLIQDMRTLVEESDAAAMVGRIAKAIPARLREPAFAVVVDLLLADGKLDGRERRFLHGLGSELKLRQDVARQIIDVIVLKNQL